MKRYVALLLTLLFCTSAWGAFPTNESTKTVNIDKLRRDFRDWQFDWRGFDDQLVTFTIEDDDGGVTLTGYYALFKASARRGGSNVLYVAKGTSDITVSGSNITFSVAKTNVPPDDVYKSELLLMDTTGTNVVRSLGRGTIAVEESLFDDDDDSWQSPSFTGADALYMLKSGYDADTNSIVDTSDAFITFTNAGGVGANAITSIVANTPATASRAGAIVTIGSDLTAATNYVDGLSNNAATVAFTGDHGDLTGLTDDDHPQYSLTDGTRHFTGSIGVTGDVEIVDATPRIALIDTSGGEDDYAFYVNADVCFLQNSTSGEVPFKMLNTTCIVQHISFNENGWGSNLVSDGSSTDSNANNFAATKYVDERVATISAAVSDTTFTNKVVARWGIILTNAFNSGSNEWAVSQADLDTVFATDVQEVAGGTANSNYAVSVVGGYSNIVENIYATITAEVAGNTANSNYSETVVEGYSNIVDALYATKAQEVAGNTAVSNYVDAATNGLVTVETDPVWTNFQAQGGLISERLFLGNGLTVTNDLNVIGYADVDGMTNSGNFILSSGGAWIGAGPSLERIVFDQTFPNVKIYDYLILANGTRINEFSTDNTLSDDSDDAVPTEKAVKGYVETYSNIVDGLYATIAAEVAGNTANSNYSETVVEGYSNIVDSQYSLTDGTRHFTGSIGVTGDVDIVDATPRIALIDTSGGEDDYAFYVNADVCYLQNSTRGEVPFKTLNTTCIVQHISFNENGWGSNLVSDGSSTDSNANNFAATKYVDERDALSVLKAGDTMSGELAMGDNKVTGLAPGTATNDAVNYGQVGASIEAATNGIVYERWNTYVLAYPTNGLSFEWKNPFPKNVTVQEIQVRDMTGASTGTLDVGMADWNDASPDTIGTWVESNIVVNSTGTADTSLSGQTTLTNGHVILFQPQDIQTFDLDARWSIHIRTITP